MANEIYTLAYVTIAGRLMTQHASVDVKRASGSSPVHTVHGGYSGESPGSPMCEISVKQAVPAADFDFEASKNIGKLIPAGTGMMKYREFGIEAPDYEPMSFYSSDGEEEDPAAFLAALEGTYEPDVVADPIG